MILKILSKTGQVIGKTKIIKSILNHILKTISQKSLNLLMLGKKIEKEK